MKKDIYQIISNDIMHDKYPDLYYINQENDINVPNSFQKKGWRHFINGGTVCKNGKTYQASYTYDIGTDYEHRVKIMTFTSFSDTSGKDLLDFIYSVLNAEPKAFILTKGLEAYDLRKYMQRVNKIDVCKTKVDALFVDTLKKYFPNLKLIEFRECHIKNECNFDSIKTKMSFKGCEIDDIRSFNDTTANLEIDRTTFNKVSNTTIYSEEINLSSNNISNSDLKILFFKCNFPNLNHLEISPYKERYAYSYLDSFTYLGDAAKKLEYLSVYGKVSSFNFLHKLQNLIASGFHSIQDYLGTWYPNVDNNQEFERIKIKNLEKYQIEKTLNPTLDDCFIVPGLEIKRIHELANIKKLISYTEEEKEFLLKNPNVIEFYKNNSVNTEVNDYYNCIFDRLDYFKKPNNPYRNPCNAKYYRIINNMLYEYSPNQVSYNKILLCKDFMFYFDGKPIVFEHRHKPIRTLEQAQKKIEGKEIKEFNLEESYYEDFIELMNELKQNPQDVKFTAWNDAVNEVITPGFPYYNYLTDFGEGGKEIKRLNDAAKRYSSCRNEARRKNKFYQEKIQNVLKEAYDNLDIEEKKYIMEHKDSYRLDSTGIKTITNHDLKGNRILESINKKTNGEYERLFNYLKLSYKTYYRGAYDGVIASSTFEKIDTNKSKEKIKKST